MNEILLPLQCENTTFMRFLLHYFFIPITILVSSCHPYNEAEEDYPASEPGNDTTNISFVSIKEAQNLYLQSQDTIIYLKGFIVGCIEGSTLSKSNFCSPFQQESNLLVADSKKEKNYQNCIPIHLNNNTSFRDQLNLVLHPENKGKRIAIKGKLEKYFSTCGIKTIKDYFFLADEYTGEPDTIGIYIISPLY